MGYLKGKGSLMIFDCRANLFGPIEGYCPHKAHKGYSSLQFSPRFWLGVEVNDETGSLSFRLRLLR